MAKVIINENQRGFLFKDGKYEKILDAGKYRFSSNYEIEISYLDQPLSPIKCAIETLLKDDAVAQNTAVVDVCGEKLALHYVDGKFSSVLTEGKHVFWSVNNKHEFKIIDVSTPEVDESIPKYVFTKIPNAYFKRIDVPEHLKGRLYIDKKFVRLLDAGTYYFWRSTSEVEVTYADTRLMQMNVSGQELLTADKVSLRINFVCSYKITDYVKVATEIDDYQEQLHVFTQLALREYVGKYNLDEILENKEGISEFVLAKLKEKESELFVNISFAGVKDIILPGEIREIMNTVLVAEKKAQANVIARREEVASTRSLLNTAKLMDENKTLYKLKELEYVERICENVGNITLNGNGGVLNQLTSILGNTSQTK